MKKLSFAQQIRKSFIFYSLLMVSIFAVLFATVMFVYTHVYIRQKNQTVNKSIASEFQKQTEYYRNGMAQLASDLDLASYLQGESTSSKVYEKLYSFVNNSKMPCLFYLLFPDGTIAATNAYSTDYAYRNQEWARSNFFKKLFQNGNQVVEDLHTQNHGEKEYGIYCFATAIQSNETQVGYLLFDLLDSGFSSLVNQYDNISVIITDAYGYSVYTNDSRLPDKFGKFFISDDKDTTIIHSTEYQHASNSIGHGLTLHTLVSSQTRNQLIQIGLIVTGFIILLMLLISLLTSKSLSRRMTKSIRTVIQGMEAFQSGNLDARIYLESNDEFQTLSETFNHMAEEIQRLLKDKQELSDVLRITEIRQLEEQFNPHFLFNVMENIRCMVITREDTQSINQAILSITKLLRYSIQHSEKDVLLKEDLAYLDLYLSLQKIRLRERLSYSIYVDKAVSDCLVPKLIVQPLVDNCIKHNYQTKMDLSIQIEAKETDGHLLIVIQDDGDGMNEEKRNTVITEMNAENPDGKHIGLYSAQRRIHLAYGTQYGIKLTSVSGEGTKIEATLPLIKEEPSCLEPSL